MLDSKPLSSAAASPADPSVQAVQAAQAVQAVQAVQAAAQTATLQREHARWVAADWRDLPGWGTDRAAELWPALQRGCARPAPAWTQICAEAALTEPGDDVSTTLWLMQHLQPWRVESTSGDSTGLLTGYFEPQFDASRRAQGQFQIPLYALPADPSARLATRRTIESTPGFHARVIAWVADPIDALLLQIQGSGRLRIQDGEQTHWVRVSYAGDNAQPYQSLGQWLIDHGELSAGHAGWPAIKDWLRRNPERQNELLWSNPRYVFFREETLSDPSQGPRGAQGAPLSAGRSIAVDKLAVPYGTPVWMDGGDALRRLAMAQDTGSAIVGAVRADLFTGWGTDAETQAGRLKAPLRLWALWPKADAN